MKLVRNYTRNVNISTHASLGTTMEDDPDHNTCLPKPTRTYTVSCPDLPNFEQNYDMTSSKCAADVFVHNNLEKILERQLYDFDVKVFWRKKDGAEKRKTYDVEINASWSITNASWSITNAY